MVRDRLGDHTRGDGLDDPQFLRPIGPRKGFLVLEVKATIDGKGNLNVVAIIRLIDEGQGRLEEQLTPLDRLDAEQLSDRL